MTRIILVDDQPLVREIVREILRDAPEIEVVGEAGDGSELLELLARQSCDLILLDISLPGKSGLELLDLIRRHFKGLQVVMLSTHSDESYLRRAREGGAAGYVQKRHAAVQLIDTIRASLLHAAG
jgi:DNA-binding NarL/FixJ family response regulator